MNKNSLFDNVANIVQILWSFYVDSVFEGEMKHRINFGQPYLGIIWNQREHRQLFRVKFSDIQDLNYSCKWYVK